MNKLIRYWNQNRVKIILVVAVIAFLIIVIQLLNQVARENNKANNAKKENVVEGLPTESIIGGQTVSTEKTEVNVNEIESFIKKCNSGDIEGAYNMLTDECKNVLFSSKLEKFKKGYYDIIFSSKRTGDIENFISGGNRYTYRVKFYNDLLSTGSVQNVNSYQDYITIDENSTTDGKLNINGFIYAKDINKENSVGGVKVIVLSKQIYKDYEKIVVKFENTTNNRILIDTRTQSKTTYAVGSDGVKYNSNISEISSALCEIPANFYRTYEITIRKTYSSGVTTESIAFTDIVPNYEEYKQNTKEYKTRMKISVSM